MLVIFTSMRDSNCFNTATVWFFLFLGQLNRQILVLCCLYLYGKIRYY